jgi:hypothetical protein
MPDEETTLSDRIERIVNWRVGYASEGDKTELLSEIMEAVKDEIFSKLARIL